MVHSVFVERSPSEPSLSAGWPSSGRNSSFMTEQKRLGLALGGGGARGLANIGVLRGLKNAGIKVSAIAGTSMGGLVGALFGAGRPLDEMVQLASQGGSAEMLHHLFDLTVSPNGFLRGDRIRKSFARALGPRFKEFSDLEIPLALVAADLRSGQEVVMTQGDLVEALRATCSVPGVFLPVEYGDTTLVDGGILNNVPADVARSLGVDIVLAVNVLPDFSSNTPGTLPLVRGLRQQRIPATVREQMHVQMIMLSAITKKRLEEAAPEIILNPVISERVGLFVGYDLAQDTVVAGEQALEEQFDTLLELLYDGVPVDERPKRNHKKGVSQSKWLGDEPFSVP
jgi:NTE family protein